MHKRFVVSNIFAFLIAFVMLVATFMLWKAEKEADLHEQESYFLELTDSIKNEISGRLAGYELILNGIKALYENSTNVTRSEYVGYIKTINFDRNGKGLLAISFVQFVPDSELNNYLDYMRDQDYGDVNIRPEGRRDNYAPITYIYPENDNNLRAIGFDLLTKDSLLESLNKSKNSGMMTVTGRVTLVQDYQDEGGNQAKVLYVPIYKKEALDFELSDRNKHLLGWVSAPFRFKDLVSTLTNSNDDEVSLDIYEGGVIDEDKHLYGNGSAHAALQASDFIRAHTIELGGKQWTLGFTTLPAFDENLNSYTHHWIAASGLLVSILSGWLVWMVGHSKNKAIALADDMTKDLRLHAKVFESSQEAFFITDELNRIISVNHGFTEITGYSSEESIGQNPSMLSSGKQDISFYKAMWERLLRDHYWQGELFNKRKNGEIYPEWLSISAVVDDDNQITNYVCVFSDLSERRKTEEAIHTLSYYDKLTGLPNRQFLLERISSIANKKEVLNVYHALLYIDIDDFKRLNESKGYQYGDLLLVEVSNRIKSCISKSDTVARLGSDEFVVLSPDLISNNGAIFEVQDLAEKIFNALKQPYDLDSYHHNINVSIGISTFNCGDGDPENILKLADVAMSQAKKTGRDKIHFFDKEMQNQLEKRVLIESSLRQSISSELMLYYQPQVHSNGAIHGAEALIRWQSSEFGFVSPADFIPIAEESGLILEIGEWVIESACKQLKVWEKAKATKHLILAINISPKQFSQNDFVQHLTNIIERYAINPDRLKLEITEGILVENMNVAVQKMQSLQKMGIRLSLDDFGTGYSSLTYLKNLPLNQLKIDRSFVSKIDLESTDKAIARTIVTLGETLGLNVIAEGVETIGQLNSLMECGCHLFQGYYFCKPLKIEDFQEFINESTLPH